MRKTFLLWLMLTLSWSGSMAAQTGAASTKDPDDSRYAITLLSSFDPIPDTMFPRNIPDHVYRTEASIFGRTIYFVRLGFYATAGEAEVAKDRMLARYPAALVTRVAPDEYLKITGGKPKATETGVAKVTPKPVLPSPPATPRASTTSISLPATPPVPVVTPAVPLPPVAAAPGVPTSKPEAAAAPTASTTTQTAVVPVPAPAAKPVSALEQEAGTFMEQARDALMHNDNVAALQILDKLLRLPPNSYSQDAQELIGLAHERQGQKTSALREYTLYLRLYPEGLGADRVRQRIVALESPPARVELKKERAETNVASVRGSLSQNYYYGQSQVDSTTTVLGPAVTSSLTSNDQSALYTNLDLHGHYSSGNWDNRFVIRDTYTASFLSNVDSTNRLYSAYYEMNNKVDEFSGRFGRQSGTSGGILGQFEGFALGYNFLPKWRINVVAGKPVELYTVHYSKLFWGASLDFGLFAEHWNGNVYYIQQTVDGIADRQAIGAEVRYFDPRGSALLYVDYDTLFSSLNIATFQATWLSSPTTTWNTLLDHRLAPTLMTSNALFNTSTLSTIPIPPVTPTPGQAGSISYWLQNVTEAQLRQVAVDSTPTFDTYVLGVSHNINSTWQIGGDVKRYNLSAIPSSPTLTTNLKTGATYMYTVQAITNGLIRSRDLSVLSLSYLDGATYQGETLAFTHRMLFQDHWTLDLALSYYLQQDDTQSNIIGFDTHIVQFSSNRIAPLIRLGYLRGKNMSIEAELGIEQNRAHSVDANITTGTSATSDTNTARHYFMLGYRWNF
jgi:hypothetical protein